MSSSPRSWRRAGTALRGWRSRQWTVTGAGALATAVLVGAPTDVVPNPLFGRSVPVQWWNYPALAVTAVLAGIVLTTYVRRPSGRSAGCSPSSPSAARSATSSSWCSSGHPVP